MEIVDMAGAYPLTNDFIDKLVIKKSVGNYVLGDGIFYLFVVKYVGRSDHDLNTRLEDWIGDYKSFKFSYATSTKDAYEKECMDYHEFGESEELDNDIHPDKPDNTNYACPVCGV